MRSDLYSLPQHSGSKRCISSNENSDQRTFGLQVVLKAGLKVDLELDVQIDFKMQ